VTITVRPSLRYSPSSIRCEKRPDLPSPKSLTPFSLAALLALSSSKEGLTEVSTLNVLAMPVAFLARLASTHPSKWWGRGTFRLRSLGGDRMPASCEGLASRVALRAKPKRAPGPCPHDPSPCRLTSAHHPHPLSLSAVPHERQKPADLMR
jgi:hypothetical protein